MKFLNQIVLILLGIFLSAVGSFVATHQFIVIIAICIVIASSIISTMFIREGYMKIYQWRTKPTAAKYLGRIGLILVSTALPQISIIAKMIIFLNCITIIYRSFNWKSIQRTFWSVIHDSWLWASLPLIGAFSMGYPNKVVIMLFLFTFVSCFAIETIKSKRHKMIPCNTI